MSKETISVRVYAETDELLKAIDFVKLRTTRSEFGRKAIEEKLEREGIDTIKKAYEKNVLRPHAQKEYKDGLN
jgi:hypothetical protein